MLTFSRSCMLFIDKLTKLGPYLVTNYKRFVYCVNELPNSIIRVVFLFWYFCKFKTTSVKLMIFSKVTKLLNRSLILSRLFMHYRNQFWKNTPTPMRIFLIGNFFDFAWLYDISILLLPVALLQTTLFYVHTSIKVSKSVVVVGTTCCVL